MATREKRLSETQEQQQEQLQEVRARSAPVLRGNTLVI